jgi:FkbM family methyltransferase
MKQLAKKILPEKMFHLIRKVIFTTIAFQGQSNSTLQLWARKVLLTLMGLRDSPRITTFQGHSNSILQCCIAYNKYGGYCVPLSVLHRPVPQVILKGDVYEPGTIEFLTSQCGDGDIVHAGTFFGDFLPALSRSIASGAKVWTFEPNPESYKCAVITTYINGLQNIELVNAGLGEHRGSLSMVVSEYGGVSIGGSSYIVKKSDNNNTKSKITTEIVTVDDIVPSNRKVSLIQLDVQYFEKQALNGALMTIRRCKPIIILETLPEENWLSKNLFGLGYRISGKVDYNTILTP